MKTQRFDNPRTIDAGEIARLIASGARPVIQFSRRGAADPLLDSLNELCARHGEALEIRFYGFYSDSFDCSVLLRLPAVANLSLDCLQRADHFDEVLELRNLRAFALGIYELEEPLVLAAPAFRNLTSLTAGATRRGNLSLAPLPEMKLLRNLRVNQETDIESLGACTELRSLGLATIGKSIPLDFLASLRKLESLRLILGGRESLGDLRLESLKSLQIQRVRAFARLDPAAFPALTSLQVEDQLQLTGLEFSEQSASLERLEIFTCKSLSRLSGLRELRSLHELRLSRTSLDLEQLLAGGLPERLRTFGFYTGKRRETEAITARLSALGYQESAPRPSIDQPWAATSPART